MNLFTTVDFPRQSVGGFFISLPFGIRPDVEPFLYRLQVAAQVQFQLFHLARLPARIHELKQEHDINVVMVERQNRRGKACHVALYSLVAG